MPRTSENIATSFNSHTMLQKKVMVRYKRD